MYRYLHSCHATTVAGPSVGRLCVRSLVCLAIAVGMLPTEESSAQTVSTPGQQTIPTNQDETKIGTGTLAFWCRPAGHRWDVLATNTTDRSYQCTIRCSFRNSNRRVTN